MRRPAAALIAVTATLALVACSPDAAEPADADAPQLGPVAEGPSPADIAALDAVTVTGELGSEPTVAFDLPFTVGAPVARVDVPGDGAPLNVGERIAIHYTMLDGEDGSVLASTWAIDTPERVTLGDPQIVTALTDILADQRVGARVVVAVPGGAATETSDAYAAVVMAMEVIDAVSPRAQGEAVPPVEGQPVVTLAEDGRPSIEVPDDAEQPTELVVQTLIRGDGPVVEAGQNVTVHYNGWLWDGTLFDSSWDTAQPMPTPIGVGNLIAGWDEGLVGQTIGSQVLLVIPPDMGYGPDGYNQIPPNATLIFVVDLLEVM